MAGEKDKNGGNTGQNQPFDPKVFNAFFKQVIKDQQDLSGTIRDILKDLNKTENSYQNIESSLDRISRGSIDVKNVQKELNKLVDREFATQKKFNELNSKQNSQRLEALKIDAKRAVERNKGLSFEDALLSRLEKQQDHSIMELFYAEKALELAQKRKKEGEKQLDTEKKLRDSLGLEGKLLKGVADKLGLGTELYEEMSREARKLNEDGGKTLGFTGKLNVLFKLVGQSAKEALRSPLFWIIGIGKGISSAFSAAQAGLAKLGQGMTAITGSGGPLSNFLSPISQIISKIPLVGGLLGGVLDIFANTVDFAINATSETQKFARALGLSYGEAKSIENSMAAFAENSGKAFLNVRKLREEQLKLSEALGINQIISNQILADSIQLKEQFGLQEDSAAELARLSIITGRNQGQIFKSLLGQTIALSKVTGVSIKFQDVIKQAANFSGVLGLTFTKYPEKLTKSLLVTKALGIDLQKLDSVASSFLDFESSISKEFEAQLFTGKDINLAKARELAMNNDLAGLAVEINKQLGTSEEFLKSNRFIQEALADATGMTRDDIADMLKKQELFAKAGATDLKTFKEKVAQMEIAGTLQSDFVSKLTEEQSQYFLSSTATEKISNFMERIRQNFATLISSPGFQNLINKVMTFLEDPNVVDNIIKKVSGFFSYIVKIVAAMLDGLDSLPFVNIDKGLRNELRGYADYLGSGISVSNLAANNAVASGYTRSSNELGGTNSKQVTQNITFKAEVVDTPTGMQGRLNRGVFPEATKMQ